MFSKCMWSGGSYQGSHLSRNHPKDAHEAPNRHWLPTHHPHDAHGVPSHHHQVPQKARAESVRFFLYMRLCMSMYVTHVWSRLVFHMLKQLELGYFTIRRPAPRRIFIVPLARFPPLILSQPIPARSKCIYRLGMLTSGIASRSSTVLTTGESWTTEVFSWNLHLNKIHGWNLRSLESIKLTSGGIPYSGLSMCDHSPRESSRGPAQIPILNLGVRCGRKLRRHLQEKTNRWAREHHCFEDQTSHLGISYKDILW